MSDDNLKFFSKYVVRRCKKRKSVKIPPMNGIQLDKFLRALERAHGYS